ncbi:unnamed protein product [Acanthoscelides obtectus]|uniref:Uncharacterized protein n=1 Tax=Acanthoscelides obtectus TaxID=200917 RepID=A0A9P0P6D2_ACAOB|nr:unnamed protein product [Acanthoscelides obtectus]CAK1667442.1 Drosomycin [Acanthoscelides obtectus]
MKGYLIFVILVLLAIGAEVAFGDCLSGKYGGPCAVWDKDLQGRRKNWRALQR